MKPKQRPTGFGNQRPLTKRTSGFIFLQQGSTIEEATQFFNKYNAKMWKTKNGSTLVNWKRIAWTWIWFR